MSLLEVKNLRKSFGELVAVADVSFEVEQGEVFGLLGPNGAGKSTTMNMIAGLIEPDAGSVWLDGRQLPPTGGQSRTALGAVPQDLSVYPSLTGRENLYFFGRLYGVERQELNRRIAEILERTGLTGRADDSVADYSGGMKRRLNFGVGLLHRPRLLILDEPTVGVDPQSRSHLLECIRDLAAEGMAAIYASHYMEEVQDLCERVGIMDHGRMLDCDRVENLLHRLNAELCLRIDRPPDDLARQLQGLGEVRLPTQNGDHATVVVFRDPADGRKLNESLSRIITIIDRSGLRLHAIETHEPDLEQLFLQMTGSRLRD